ncbi:uncharacterized protein HMPREF1541_05363 [Cyphellophora europaea CBS 101466]|uniref:BTB domain-containing protein n=1 Tax=Cyphellophora europaea (strain CBS 101466) TaxID=1220924 RepID=W2RS50_CYPE1|nr:uncharacterized protein HMPREF1541_05363 [Cyphellophora europaea CBS 101466]ETN39140.1 hypothetical protein HMPREF1541_05363 [Cyphellophora europaea CBS 101466]
MAGNQTPRRGRAADALSLALGASSVDSDENVRSPPSSEANGNSNQHDSPRFSRSILSPSISSQPESRDRPAQRRAASANQVHALAAGEQSSSQAIFESPLRSILVSGPPTASVSANTALASLSAATTSTSAGPYAALTSASARMQPPRFDDVLSSPPRSALPPLLTLEKDLDDPETGSSVMVQENSTLPTTLSRLFAVSDIATPAPASRLHSHLRSLSNHGRSLNDTSTLTGHLFHKGFAEGRHSDITILAFGEAYRLHKLVLDRVPFFSSAFSGPWAESSAKEMELHPEEIDSNITKTAFELALKRMYGTHFPMQEEQEAVSLFATACWLNLPDLVESSVDSILRQMQPPTLHHLIRLVTNNYYGKAGDRIMASAKAMLCREGWEMEYQHWDAIPSELIREVIGGDPFFVPSEWERWFLATKILNRKLKAQAIEAGLVSTDGRFLYSKPMSLRFFAVRFDTTYRRQSGLGNARNVSDRDAPWVSLYTSPEIAPLLVLLDEGIHYIHLRFEQLQQIRSHRDIFGVPILPEKVISDALWMSMELRQRVLNAHENDLELGLAQVADEDDEDVSAANAPSGTSKGKQRDTRAADQSEDEDEESASWDGNGRPRKFWIPSDDISCVMGGTREAHAAATASNTDWTTQATARLSASLEPTDMTWASDFVLDSGRPMSQSLSNAAAPQYTSIPPFRFSAEFPNPRTLKEKKRIYSKTFWYAGSLWNLYIQRVHTSKNQQLGIYLHRAKESSPSDDPLAQVVPASVDDRIGQLEREMLLRKTERRNRPWQDRDHETGSLETFPESRTVEKEEAKSPEPWTGPRRSSTSNMTRLFDSDEEDEELLRTNRRNNVPTMPPYLDTRPVIKTYFKIYSPDKAGRLLSIYESAPEKFVVSKSWGWKSSQMVLDDGGASYDLSRGAKESKLRYMVVIGNV